jgi:hypothetical protein
MGRKALDILKDIADQLGWPQPSTVENESQLPKESRKLLRALNRVLRAMSSINDWHFLRAEGEITLVAAYTTGTMRLTNSATTCTGQVDSDGNSPTWTSSHVGRAIVISGHPVVYRVSAVNSATSITLDKNFIGTTSDGGTTQDDYTYKIVQDRFDLPTDFDRPVSDTWTRYDGSSSSPVAVVEPDQVAENRRERSPHDTGDPTKVTIWRHDDQGEHRVAVFDPYPDTARIVAFEYQKLHPKIELDNQRVLFDQRREDLIMSGVEYLILRGPEDDMRAQMLLGEFLQSQNIAVSKDEIGTKRTRITHSQERALRERSKWQRKGRRINWGAYFDRANYYDL